MTDWETIIIGAGPAGLACGAALRARGRKALHLEATDRVAASWHAHYDRLHLHTSKAHSALPGQPMPADFPRYPSRHQVIDYLRDYAESNGLRILFGKTVTSVRKEREWVIETSDEDCFRSKAVIVAAGLSNTPVRPRWDGQESFIGQCCIHRNSGMRPISMLTRC